VAPALGLTESAHWPPLESLSRVALALAVGLFVGLEREWRGKEAGLRTFGFVSLLGALGGLLGTSFALAAIAAAGVLVTILNVAALRTTSGIELTTSAALMVTVLTGIACGFGHRVTPAAIAVVTTGLLAYKEKLATFSHRLTAEELRSAILLAILAFAIYPALPRQAVDPWRLLDPRPAFVAVLLVAALGFVNYVAWKLAGPRGMTVTGFLGGLVNSTVTVAELSERVRMAGAREVSPLALRVVFQAIALATLAMLVRNAALLGLLSPRALGSSWPAFALMGSGAVVTAGLGVRMQPAEEAEGPALPLVSPFSLKAAFRYGLVFVALSVTGELGRRAFGVSGLYGVSILGGLISSSSAVASAGSMGAAGSVPWHVAGIAAVLASLASVLVNLVLVGRVARNRWLTGRVAVLVVSLVALGVLGSFGIARVLGR
jgi:uncharacterized membrane protein (DUF4010 family)